MSFFRRKPRPESQQPPPTDPNPNPTQIMHNGAPGPSHQYQQRHDYGQQYPPAHYPNHYNHHPPPPPPRARGPPPGADPRLWQFFTSVDTDGSGAIDVNELQRALVNANWSSK